jgi:hypothetical protein
MVSTQKSQTVIPVKHHLKIILSLRQQNLLLTYFVGQDGNSSDISQSSSETSMSFKTVAKSSVLHGKEMTPQSKEGQISLINLT